MAKYLLLVAAFLTGAACIVAMSRASQEEQYPVFRVQVDMVMLDVAVTDGKGKYVMGLKPSDFAIFEDGIEQQLATFAEGNAIPRRVVESLPKGSRVQQGQPDFLAPQTQLRVGDPQSLTANTPGDHSPSLAAGANVFVLFDTSNSMYTGFVYAQQAISDFVRFLDAPDRVALYSFSRNLKRVAPLSNDRDQVIRALRSTVAGDYVALYNALLITLKDAARFSGRKTIVVFSNGPDNASMVSPEDVRELSQAEGIPIYIISTREAEQNPASAAVFERISTSTGGKAYFAKTWSSQQKAFTSIREDLAHLYTLSYYPEKNPNNGWRKITVKLVGNKLKRYITRTRVGYRPKSIRIAEQPAIPQP